MTRPEKEKVKEILEEYAGCKDPDLDKMVAEIDAIYSEELSYSIECEPSFQHRKNILGTEGGRE